MKFRELYNKAREEQNVSLDENLMWDNIESGLDKPKRKRRFLWLFFGFVIGVVSIILLSTYGLDYKEGNTTNVVRSSASHNSEVIQPNVNLNQSNPSQSNLNQSESSQSNPSQSEVSPSKINQPVTIASEVTRASQRANSNVKLAHTNHESPNTLQGSAPDVESYSADLVRGSKNDVSTKLTNGSGDIHSQALLPTSIDDLITDRQYKHGSLTALPIIPLNDYLSYEESILDVNLDVAQSVEQQLDDEKQDSNQGLELSIALNILSCDSEIMDNSNTSTPWADVHQASKSSARAIELGSLLTYRLPSGLGLGVGLKLRKVSEWYDATITESTTRMIPSDSAIFVIINDVQEYSGGLLTETTTQRTSYHTPIRRYYLDIPIQLSYRYQYQKLNFEVYSAYNLNVSHHYSGRSYYQGLMLLDQSGIDEQKIYSNRFVNSMNLGVNISHAITSDVHIGLSLNYWQQWASSISKQNDITEQYNGIGIGLSVSKRLF